MLKVNFIFPIILYFIKHQLLLQYYQMILEISTAYCGNFTNFLDKI